MYCIETDVYVLALAMICFHWESRVTASFYHTTLGFSQTNVRGPWVCILRISVYVSLGEQGKAGKTQVEATRDKQPTFSRLSPSRCPG